MKGVAHYRIAPCDRAPYNRAPCQEPNLSPESIGFIAALLTTGAFVPQAWMTVRTRDTRSISLAMYIVFNIGIALWLAYGVLIDSRPMIWANVITLALAMTILTVKWQNRHRDRVGS